MFLKAHFSPFFGSLVSMEEASSDGQEPSDVLVCLDDDADVDPLQELPYDVELVAPSGVEQGTRHRDVIGEGVEMLQLQTSADSMRVEEVGKAELSDPPLFSTESDKIR